MLACRLGLARVVGENVLTYATYSMHLKSYAQAVNVHTCPNSARAFLLKAQVAILPAAETPSAFCSICFGTHPAGHEGEGRC